MSEIEHDTPYSCMSKIEHDTHSSCTSEIEHNTHSSCMSPIEHEKGKTVFKIFIWGDISSDIRQEILRQRVSRAVKHNFRLYMYIRLLYLSKQKFLIWLSPV